MTGFHSRHIVQLAMIENGTYNFLPRTVDEKIHKKGIYSLALALYNMENKLARAAFIVLLKANNLEYENESEEKVIEKIKDHLCLKTFIRHKNIILKYFNYCLENSYIWASGETVTNYILNGIKEHNWSGKYSRLITTVLNKYILFNAIEKPKYHTIKRKAYHIIPNKFDGQSFDDDQILKMLTIINQKATNDDLFLLLVIMSGTGLRFIETTQLTLRHVVNLLNGHTETIQSAKTRQSDTIKLLGKYQSSMASTERPRLRLNDTPIGDVCLEKIESGIYVKNTKNKPVLIGMDDIIFFKNYESYRSRFKPVKDQLITKGTGVMNKKKGTTRGSNFHSFRRHFANALDRSLDSNISANLRTNVIAQGLRHTSLSSTHCYVRPSTHEVDQLYNDLF